MSDPHWQRDPAWVLEQIRWAQRFGFASDLRALLDSAEGRVRNYAKAGRPVWEDDQAFQEELPQLLVQLGQPTTQARIGASCGHARGELRTFLAGLWRLVLIRMEIRVGRRG